MNYRMILYLMGWVFNIVSACLLLPIAVGMFYGEVQWKYYLAVALVSLAAGLILSHKKPKRNVFYAKEGFVTVAMTWIILSLVGAVPFYVTGEIPSYVDAVFETASGFSTTGASILTNVEALSRTALFWKLYSLDWRDGRACFPYCNCSAHRRSHNAAYESGKPGTIRRQNCA